MDFLIKPPGLDGLTHLVSDYTKLGQMRILACMGKVLLHTLKQATEKGTLK